MLRQQHGLVSYLTFFHIWSLSSCPITAVEPPLEEAWLGGNASPRQDGFYPELVGIRTQESRPSGTGVRSSTAYNSDSRSINSNPSPLLARPSPQTPRISVSPREIDWQEQMFLALEAEFEASSSQTTERAQSSDPTLEAKAGDHLDQLELTWKQAGLLPSQDTPGWHSQSAETSVSSTVDSGGLRDQFFAPAVHSTHSYGSSSPKPLQSTQSTDPGYLSPTSVGEPEGLRNQQHTSLRMSKLNHKQPIVLTPINYDSTGSGETEHRYSSSSPSELWAEHHPPGILSGQVPPVNSIEKLFSNPTDFNGLARPDEPRKSFKRIKSTGSVMIGRDDKSRELVDSVSTKALRNDDLADSVRENPPQLIDTSDSFSRPPARLELDPRSFFVFESSQLKTTTNLRSGSDHKKPLDHPFYNSREQKEALANQLHHSFPFLSRYKRKPLKPREKRGRRPKLPPILPLKAEIDIPGIPWPVCISTELQENILHAMWSKSSPYTKLLFSEVCHQLENESHPVKEINELAYLPFVTKIRKIMRDGGLQMLKLDPESLGSTPLTYPDHLISSLEQGVIFDDTNYHKRRTQIILTLRRALSNKLFTKMICTEEGINHFDTVEASLRVKLSAATHSNKLPKHLERGSKAITLIAELFPVFMAVISAIDAVISSAGETGVKKKAAITFFLEYWSNFAFFDDPSKFPPALSMNRGGANSRQWVELTPSEIWKQLEDSLRMTRRMVITWSMVEIFMRDHWQSLFELVKQESHLKNTFIIFFDRLNLSTILHVSQAYSKTDN